MDRERTEVSGPLTGYWLDAAERLLSHNGVMARRRDSAPLRSSSKSEFESFMALGVNWWARQGSNLPPAGYEPAALPLSYGPVRLAYARRFQGVKASGLSAGRWGLGGSRQRGRRLWPGRLPRCPLQAQTLAVVGVPGGECASFQCFEFRRPGGRFSGQRHRSHDRFLDQLLVVFLVHP